MTSSTDAPTGRQEGKEGEPGQAGLDKSSIGSILRRVREKAGMSQRALADRVNISRSMISQIESGQTRPSVDTLYALTRELGVSMDALFEHQSETPVDELETAPESNRSVSDEVNSLTASHQPTAMGVRPLVIRHDERPLLKLDTNVTWERLAAGGEHAMDFVEIVYGVGGSSSRDETLMRHNSVEFGVVLSGRLMVQTGFETTELAPGDSIAFASSTPHRLWNPGDVPTHAIWVTIDG
ncbi:MAG: XRE family transcriptional regulator [Acidimicrobiia bacterium]